VSASFDEGTPIERFELKSDYYPQAGNLIDQAGLQMVGENRLYYYRPDATDGTGAFWYLEWAGGPSTKDGVEVEGPRYELRFHGWATGLDGVRHLYFTDDGYVFYPQSSMLIEALQALYKLFPENY
jgi:hypothetical protein